MITIKKAAASLLTFAVLLTASISANASDAAKEDCFDQWVQSDANRTCLPIQISGSPAEKAEQCAFTFRCIVNMDCTLESPCNKDSGAIVESGMSWQGAIGDVSRLQNCSGTIQALPCSVSSVSDPARDQAERGVGRFVE